MTVTATADLLLMAGRAASERMSFKKFEIVDEIRICTCYVTSYLNYIVNNI